MNIVKFKKYLVILTLFSLTNCGNTYNIEVLDPYLDVNDICDNISNWEKLCSYDDSEDLLNYYTETFSTQYKEEFILNNVNVKETAQYPLPEWTHNEFSIFSLENNLHYYFRYFSTDTENIDTSGIEIRDGDIIYSFRYQAIFNSTSSATKKLTYSFGKLNDNDGDYVLNIFNNNIPFGTILIKSSIYANKNKINETYFTSYFDGVLN